MSSEGLFDGIKNVKPRGGVELDEILKAETDLGVKFSAEYKSYLLKYGEVSCYGHELTGICKIKRLSVVDATKEVKQNGYQVPDGYYVIEELHIDGIVYFQNSKGEIYSIQPNSEPILVYKSIREYLLDGIDWI